MPIEIPSTPAGTAFLRVYNRIWEEVHAKANERTGGNGCDQPCCTKSNVTALPRKTNRPTGKAA